LLCEEYVKNKISIAEEAVNNAQNAANKESKCSAGDKYETGRAMLHLDVIKYSAQLHEGIKLKKILNQIDYEKTYENVQSGSLVYTSNGIYFILIGAGKFNIDGIDYTTVSFSSPIGQELFNKTAGDRINFRNKIYDINSIL
jgi:hypothetical protein